MQKKIVVVSGDPELCIETAKVYGVQRFRWTCTCRDTAESSWLHRKYSREAQTTLEALRQHWTSVHFEKARVTPINWVGVNNQIPWLTDTAWIRLENGVSVSGAPSSLWDYKEEEKKGMSRLSDIEARMRELEKEAAKYARFPKTDEWPVGTVITYNWSPNRNDMAEVYAYAVFKATDTAWYWTGHSVSKKSGGTYDTLVECLAEDGVSDIMVATPDAFKPLFPEVVEDSANGEVLDKIAEHLNNPGGYVPQVKRADG